MYTRRHILYGLGGCFLALPWFEGLEKRASAQSASLRHRFLFVMRSGNGIVQADQESSERFWPNQLGALTVDSLKNANADRATSELADYAEKLILLKNVSLPFARNVCGHAEAIPQVLTAANHTGGDGNNPLALGRSIDWLIAEKLNDKGVDPLCFMSAPSSAYIGFSLSWNQAQQRASAEKSPKAAFDRLTGLSSAPEPIQALIAKRRKSINDLVREQLSDLKQSSALSMNDRKRLDQHLSVVRDIETNLNCTLDDASAQSINAQSDPLANDSRVDTAQLFMDIAAWAFNCRLNHAAVLQMGTGNDQTEYILKGTKLPSFHWISHRISSDGSTGQPIANAVDLHHEIDRLQLRTYRHLLDRLSSYASPYGGTLLNDCAAVWTNDLGNGPAHDASITPWVISGGAGGLLKTAQFVDHKKRGVNLVLNTLITAMGITKSNGSPTDDFGDASLPKGVLSELLI